MEGPNRKKAEELAALDWTTYTVNDELSDGTPVYVAYVAFLDGCMTQGTTRGEAFACLKEALPDFIECMLDDGLPIPVPTKTIMQGWSV